MPFETQDNCSDDDALRILAPDVFYAFVQYMFKARKGYGWQRAPHHKAICDALTRVFLGECKRLIINVPPRYGKTEVAIINFMAWALGQVPDAEFIHASYSARLATNNSYQTREIVRSDEYRRIFPHIALREDSQAKDEWRTTAGGVVYAVGAGGTITGYGAGKQRPNFGGALLLDDLHKADEARSDVIRENVIEWFRNTLESRKNGPETPIVLIMQRLHERDIAGWLLDGGNGEQWEHLCIPALAEANDPLGREVGEALWPAKHTREDLLRMQAASPYTFSGQYQQRPSPAEGGLFKPNQIQIIDAAPVGSGIRWVRAWDLASTTDGDWTAGAKLGMLPDGRLVIADMQRMRVGPDERDFAIVNTAARDGRQVLVSLPQDPGQAGKTQVIYLTRRLAGYRVKSSPESGDKVTRAEPFAAQVNVTNAQMVRGPWNEALIAEMQMFPNGAHDDQIDALSRAYAELIDRPVMQIADDALQADIAADYAATEYEE